ncbi:App1 family protein [Microlunatus ginsengisoli]|uniref:App1 family protein n=1 Tax=Microlunatus ginsengisoli TaxID=363863 RepID=A0ABP7AWK0_9ACTN
MVTPTEESDQLSVHRAARVDYAISRWRARRARARGARATVISYTGYGTTSWIRVLGRVLLTREPFGWPHQFETGARGWRSFTAVPVENGVVVLRIGDRELELTADRNGIVDIRLPVELDPGWHALTLQTEGSEPIPAKVYVIADDTTFGVVSDIDDTVMVTSLPRPMLAAWHTFVVNEHARATTPGMPVLYERINEEHPDAPFIYLSTGAWNVAPTLTRFLSRNLYPAGALLLTDWGPTADRWFRSGQEHKRTQLRRLASEFPRIRWLLIGDDGQHDPQLYGDFAAEHPEHVAAVAIRQLGPGEAVLAGGSHRSPARGTALAVPWLHAPDGAAFAAEFEQLGLIAGRQREPEI